MGKRKIMDGKLVQPDLTFFMNAILICWSCSYIIIFVAFSSRDMNMCLVLTTLLDQRPC